MFSPPQPLQALPPSTASATSPTVLGAPLSLMFAPRAEAEPRQAFFPSPETRATSLPITSPALAPIELPPPVELVVEAEDVPEGEQPRAEADEAPQPQPEAAVATEEVDQPVEAASSGDAEVEGPTEEEQAWESFREEYYEIVTELPLEYERKFKLIRELEDAQQDSTEELKASLRIFIRKMQEVADRTAQEVGTESSEGAQAIVVDGQGQAEGPAKEVKEDQVDARPYAQSMDRILKAAIKAGEDKIGLAQTLYEAVDRHIQRLDADLAQSEDSLVIGLREGTLPSHDVPSLSLKDAPGATTSRGAIALGELPPYSGEEEAQTVRGGSGLAKTGGKVGMSVDPNEPRYCFCNRVSFGEMVGCDNEDCKREWFHFECVGITARPEGDWLCADCQAKGVATQARPANKTKRRRLY